MFYYFCMVILRDKEYEIPWKNTIPPSPLKGGVRNKLKLCELGRYVF